MKIYKIKRLSDNQIMFIQKHELIDDVKIPKNWGLWLEHQAQSKDENGTLLFDEFEQPIMETVAATCEIIEEEIPVPTYGELRKARYVKEIDPLAIEALLDHAQGDSTKLNALLAKKNQIKTEIPKPN